MTPALSTTNNSVVGMTMMDCYGNTRKKGGGDRKERNSRMEVAGIDICVSVCSLLKNPNPCQKNTPHKKIHKTESEIFVRECSSVFAVGPKKSQP